MAVEKGESVRRAAEKFNAPKSTLHDHVTIKVMFGARSGPDPYLSMEEEELASFLVGLAIPTQRNKSSSWFSRFWTVKGLTQQSPMGGGKDFTNGIQI